MLILIDGFWGSGKTVLRSLLDGHSELKVSPSQESIISSFYRNKNKSNYFLYKDIRLVREFLVDSYYYNLEFESIKGYQDSDLEKKKIDFDFYKFENEWINDLQNEKFWNEKIIISKIYTSIMRYYYKDMNISEKDKLVIMEDNSFYSHKFFLETFEDAKLIVVKKNMPDIIASLVNRKINKNDYKTIGYKNFNFNYLVKENLFPKKIISNHMKLEELHNDYPSRVFVSDFYNLILNTKDEMEKISKFIEIDFQKVLIKPTHFGSDIIYKDNKSILGKQKFIAREILSNYQNKLLDNFEKKNSFFSLAFFEYLFINLNYALKSFVKKIFNFVLRKDLFKEN